MGAKNQTDIDLVRQYAGDIEEKHLKYVETFVTGKMAVFMPIGANYGYAVQNEHAHPCPLFTLYFDESGILEVGGREYPVKSGQTVFLAPGVLHKETVGDYPARYIGIFLPLITLKRFSGKYDVSWDELPQLGFYETPRGLMESLTAFMEEYGKDLPGQDEILTGITVQIVHILVRMLFEIKTKSKNHFRVMTDHPLVNRVIDYIHKNMDKKITISQLALVAHLSISHFSYIFQKEMGQSPYQYLLLSRLHHSRQLLDEGKMSLTEIALACGFSSSSHFTSAFQKEFFSTPSEYRKSRNL